MEATGYSQWFVAMLAEQGHELWVGDAAEIRATVLCVLRVMPISVPR